MDFYIKQSATQPILLMKLNRDNIFSYEKFQKALENSTITFSMIDSETNILKIAKKSGGIIEYVYPEQESFFQKEYFIYYKFSSQETNKPGRYKGEFEINFFDYTSTEMTGTFIAPIHEDLYINIEKSLFSNSNISNNSNEHIFTGIFNTAFT